MLWIFFRETSRLISALSLSLFLLHPNFRRQFGPPCTAIDQCLKKDHIHLTFKSVTHVWTGAENKYIFAACAVFFGEFCWESSAWAGPHPMGGWDQLKAFFQRLFWQPDGTPPPLKGVKEGPHQCNFRRLTVAVPQLASALLVGSTQWGLCVSSGGFTAYCAETQVFPLLCPGCHGQRGGYQVHGRRNGGDPSCSWGENKGNPCCIYFGVDLPPVQTPGPLPPSKVKPFLFIFGSQGDFLSCFSQEFGVWFSNVAPPPPSINCPRRSSNEIVSSVSHVAMFSH